MKKQALVLALLFIAPPCFAERWVINTLEWPPFVCSRCPDNGAAAKALRDTLKQAGVDVEFVFYNWTQTLRKGSQPDVVGIFPAWREEQREGFTYSSVLFRSPVGFVEARTRPLQWKELKDLKGKRISLTQDYGVPVELAGLMDKKVIHQEIVWDDFSNIRGVALGKVDGAMMDINNANYYIHVAQPSLAGRVTVNPRILETKDLYFAINSYNTGKLKKLEASLKKVNFQRMVDDYLVKYLKK